MRETVEIVKLGHAGDGVAADGLFVPYAVPGDVLRAVRDGPRGKIEEILSAGAARVPASCRHFGVCGGCALQMLERGAYLSWKREQVLTALKQRGFESPPVEDIRTVGPGTRRRASFKAKRSGDRIGLGFYEPDSRNLVDVAECPVLAPALAKLVPKMRAALLSVLRPGETAELFTTEADNGIDLSLKLKRARDADILMSLAQFANTLRLVRLSWNGEVLAMEQPPQLAVGKFQVVLPSDSFLQPTREGERILQELVRAELGGAKRVADLFSGCGTFSLVAVETASVHAADSSETHIAALQTAAKKGGAKLTSETRDLFRRPYAPVELHRFDAVLLDPPRAGAQAQAQALANSTVPRILYVSCNPASFARDARILADGGYALARAVPLDQFLWSPHVETFAVFIRV